MLQRCKPSLLLVLMKCVQNLGIYHLDERIGIQSIKGLMIMFGQQSRKTIHKLHFACLVLPLLQSKHD
jgi:hypothetical protein